MRWLHLLASLSIFSAAVLASEEPVVAAEAVEVPTNPTGEPEIAATAEFTHPDKNIINGERNTLTVYIENKSERNVTLRSIGGSLSHPDTGAVIKNLTTDTFDFQLVNGLKVTLPYAFFSEHKPGDMRLNVWLNHIADDETYRVMAFDSVVAVVEPAKSIFDFQLLTTYLTILAFAGAFAYYTYDNLRPQPKKGRKAVKTETTAETTATATGASYSEEWIPEHHMRKGGKKGGKGLHTSGDELSGGETSDIGKKKKTTRK